MKTIAQVADWIMQHRRGKAFKDYPYIKVVDELCMCADAQSMVCITDVDDSIVGVVCGRDDKAKRTLYIHDILTVKKGVFLEMIKYFQNKYPGYALQGTRKDGKLIAYNNVERLKKLTTIYGK